MEKDLETDIQEVYSKDALSLCFALIVLQNDNFHDRYRRRGLGHKKTVNLEELLSINKVKRIWIFLSIRPCLRLKSADVFVWVHAMGLLRFLSGPTVQAF